MTLSGRYPYHKLSSISSAQLVQGSTREIGSLKLWRATSKAGGWVECSGNMECIYMQKERHTVQYEHGHKLKNIGNCIHPCFSRMLMVWDDWRSNSRFESVYSCHLKWLGGPIKKCCKGGMTVDWLCSWFTGILIFPSYFFQIMFTKWWHWQGEKQKRYYTVFEKDIRKAVCCCWSKLPKNQSSQGSVRPLVGLVSSDTQQKKKSPIFFHSSDLPTWQEDIMMTRGLVAAREMKLGAFAKPVRAACLGAGVRYLLWLRWLPSSGLTMIVFVRISD